MASDPTHDPSLTVALALCAGMVGQTVATHLRVPGIVVLLAAGVVLGPDLLGWVYPSALGEGLDALVGFAVAVILFEGGMNLSIPQIQRSGAAIQRLITVGALVTAIGGALAVYVLMGWDLRMSVLFGTLVIVTGPTVITPLLRRLRVERSVATILEAEGVLIDPVGAIVAVVGLEVALAPTASSVALGAPEVLIRLGVGAAIGAAAGFGLSQVLRVKGLVPEGLVNVFTLSIVLVVFFVSDTVLHESGIAAVTAAGIAVRYLGTPVERELLEFKEQLTTLLIGMLFVLLAADVRLAEVRELGWPGVGVALALILIVRPANVLAGTLGTGLSWKQMAFLAWIAPRGIVAAAVASLFSVQLDRAGIAGGTEMRALVFLVIALTVLLAGLTGGWVAQALGLRRPSNQGWVVLGAHGLARTLARSLLDAGEEVLLIDINPEHTRLAEREGMRVLHGNALKETTLGRAELDTRRGVIGLTRNEEVNFLFVQKAKQTARVQRLFVSLSDASTGVTPKMIHAAHAHILFGGAHDVERWASRIEQGRTRMWWCRFEGAKDGGAVRAVETRCDGWAIPVVYVRQGAVAPVGDHVTFRAGDEVRMVVESLHEEQVIERLRARGFEPMAPTDTETREAG